MGGGLPQLWEPGLNGVGQFLGDLNFTAELFEFSGRKQRNEARVRVCGQTHPGLTFLGSIAVRQPLAIWISFFVNLLLRIHF